VCAPVHDKGHELVLRAIATLARKVSGPGATKGIDDGPGGERLLTLSRELRLPDRVQFHVRRTVAKSLSNETLHLFAMRS